MTPTVSRCLCLSLMLVVLSGCPSPTDAVTDSGALDAGKVTPADAGVDAGSPLADSGLNVLDAGSQPMTDSDSGVTFDAGAPDAGAPDAGPMAPTDIIYSPSSATCFVNEACTVNAPMVTGGAGLFSVTPALPAGLTFDAVTGGISGVASALSAPMAYSIRVTNSAGFATTSLPLQVTLHAPTQLAYPTGSLACTINVACTLGPPTATGGVIRSFSVSPPLPSGFSLDTGTGLIAGTGTSLAAAQTHTVRAENQGGSTTTLVTISVVDVPPSGLTYPDTSVACFQGAPCTIGPPTVTGNVTSYSVSPSLPAGLTISSSTGVINGTPTVATTGAVFTIRALNTGGSSTFALTLRVLAPISVQPPVLDISALAKLDLQLTGAGLTHYKSKIVADAGQCTDPAGYSAVTPLSTRLTDSVVSFVDTSVTLCAVGSNGVVWQREAEASSATLVDATLPSKGSAQVSLTMLQAPDIDAGTLAQSHALFTADAGVLASATCAGCEVSTDDGQTWSTTVPDAGNGLTIHVRHVTASTPITETTSTLTWSAGSVWTFKSLTKAPECAPGDKRLFLSDTFHNGQFVPFSTADDFCQAEAVRYGVSGVWHAMLSTITPLSPLDANTTYCSLEGRQLVVNRVFVAPLMRRVSGKPVNPGVFTSRNYPVKPRTIATYWVGNSSSNCSSWSANTSVSTGYLGGVSWGDTDWTYLQKGGVANPGCDVPASLLCFE